jgi:CRP-like cAMP-binding protein
MLANLEQNLSGDADHASSALQLGRLVRGDLNLVSGFLRAPRQFRKNQDVVIAGRHYGVLFVNHDGWLSRYKILRSGDRQIVDFILPGQIFGLQACLFKASLCSISTVTDAMVSSIPLEVVDDMFDRNPGLAKAVFWSAICETAIVSEHLIDTARRSAYERLSHFLLELFVRLKATGQAHGMSFKMPLTQELIADALGLTTVHVNRTLRSLREDKLIEVDNKSVTILDFDALSLLSDFDNSYLGETARALHGEMPWEEPMRNSERASGRAAAPRGTASEARPVGNSCNPERTIRSLGSRA